MAFTGEPVNADKALAWGLVSEVVSPDELMNAARKLAARIAVNPPTALRMTKKLLREGRKFYPECPAGNVGFFAGTGPSDQRSPGGDYRDAGKTTASIYRGITGETVYLYQ